MDRRSLSLAVLATLVVAAPADARRAQRLEKRVRAIETSLLGGGHAAEHARQRALRRRAARRARGARQVPLAADNSFQPFHVGGRWEQTFDLPIVAIHATLLRTGRVLIFSYPWRPGRPDPDNPGQTLPDSGRADAYVFDPVTGVSRQVDPPINPDTGKPAVIFCAGTSTLADGRVLVTGGDVGDPTASPNRGLDTIYLFDPGTETWQTGPRMRQGRWYPTQLELPDGRTVIVAGLPEVTDPDAELQSNADVEIFSPNGSLQRLRNFRIDGKPGHPPLIGMYPHMWWMPSGHALIAGPRRSDSWLFHPPVKGRDNARWTPLNHLPGIHREWAAGALLPGTAAGGSPRAMLFGGADRDDRDTGGAGKVYPAVASTIVFDDESGQWSAGPAMNEPRAFANSVLLPDGRIAIVGGGIGDDGNKELYRWQYTEAQKRIEIYDPGTQTFTFGNAQAEARTYHSSALLLPDARVMSAGDDINGPTGPDSGVRTDTAEIWSPPYLYRPDGTPAPRPQITTAPVGIAYAKPFVVGTDDTDITGAVLVAPGADTHANDMSQRLVALGTPQAVPGGVNLVAPGSANLAPPGYYMLFLINAQGVPSHARFVSIGPSAQPAPVPSPTPAPSVTATATATPDPVPFAIRLRAQRPPLGWLRRSRRMTVTVTPNRAADVRLTLSFGGRRLARARMRFAAGLGRTKTLELTKRGARRLAGRRRATLVLRASGTPSSGAAVKVRRRLRLRR